MITAPVYTLQLHAGGCQSGNAYRVFHWPQGTMVEVMQTLGIGGFGQVDLVSVTYLAAAKRSNGTTYGNEALRIDIEALTALRPHPNVIGFLGLAPDAATGGNVILMELGKCSLFQLLLCAQTPRLHQSLLMPLQP